MNVSTLLGVLFGVVALTVALLLTSSSPLTLVNPEGLLIVVFGTLAATFVAYPAKEVGRAVLASGKVFSNEHLHLHDDIEEIIHVAKLWFRGDLNDVLNEMPKIKNPFLRSGLQFVADGVEFDEIRELLSWRLSRVKAREYTDASVFRSMASFAPAFGMIGTVVGLVAMMQNLADQDLRAMAFSMAVALLTTLYGLLLANLVLKPIAIKLERRTEARVVMMGMIVEGVRLISERRQPSYVKATLYSFLVHHQDELHDTGSTLSDDELHEQELAGSVKKAKRTSK
jgi:chemotaxis protein MotA